MKQFFFFLMVISLSSAFKRQSSFVKFTWSCENDKCIKKIVEYGSRENIQSYGVCKLLCGDSIIWPNPVSKMIKGPATYIGKIQFDPDFILKNDTENTPIKELVIGAIDVFMDRINKETNLNHNFFGSFDKILQINIIITDTNISSLSLSTEQEYYEININASETEENLINAVIKGGTFFGIRHGLETLSQLIVHDDLKGCLVIPSEVLIKDYPQFPYRGIMLDTSRNYFSVDSIKRTIDIMSANKLNSFHWHISDTQSFPLKLEKYKDFAKYGAYSPEKIYTEADIKSLVNYGKIRGVRIIPELDAPSHTGEGWQSTEAGTNLCFNQEPWGAYCGEPPCGQLNPVSDSVYNLLGGFYVEFIRLFETNILHLGGDEVAYSCWESSDEIKKWITNNNSTSNTNGDTNYNEFDSMTRKELFYSKTERELFFKLELLFQEKALKKLRETDKGSKLDVILWTSKLTDSGNIENLKYNDYIIQVWSSKGDARRLIENNFRVILSNNDALYLDCGFGKWVSAGNNWCTPYKPWQIIYDNKIEVPGGKEKFLLGQEAPLWTETASEGSLDSRLWPRGAALAERTWTNPKSNWTEAEGRMLYHTKRLVKLGSDAAAIEPEWCTINRDGCSYVINN